MGIHPALGEEAERLRLRTVDPADVRRWIEPHVCRHARQEGLAAASKRAGGDGLPLQVEDSADLVGPEQLEAADLNPCQKDDRIACIHLDDGRSNELHAEIDMAGN